MCVILAVLRQPLLGEPRRPRQLRRVRFGLQVAMEVWRQPGQVMSTTSGA
jgi:hypothetical protein